MAARFPILFLTGLLFAADGLAFAGGRPQQKGVRKMESHVDSIPNANCPFAISLAVLEGPGLRLSMRNQSANPHAYLSDASLQPSLLLIHGEDGKGYAPRDDRKIKKRNTIPEEEDYKTLPPGATDTVYEAGFEREGAGYTLKWGPFLYQGLTPGKYRVRAGWRSALNAWRDPDTGKQGKMSGLWMGKTESNEAVVVLP